MKADPGLISGTVLLILAHPDLMAHLKRV